MRPDNKRTEVWNFFIFMAGKAYRIFLGDALGYRANKAKADRSLCKRRKGWGAGGGGIETEIDYIWGLGEGFLAAASGPSQLTGIVGHLAGSSLLGAFCFNSLIKSSSCCDILRLT